MSSTVWKLDAGYHPIENRKSKIENPDPRPADFGPVIAHPSFDQRMNFPGAALCRILFLMSFAALCLPPSAGVAQDAYAEDVPAYNDYVARSFLIEVEPLVGKYTG